MRVVFEKKLFVYFVIGIIIGLGVGFIGYTISQNNNIVIESENIKSNINNNVEEVKISTLEEAEIVDTPTYSIEYFSELFNIPSEDILKFKNYETIEGITYDLYTFDDEFGDTLEAAIMISKDSSKAFTYYPDGTKENLTSHELYLK